MSVLSRIKTIIDKKVIIPRENRKGEFIYAQHKVFFPKDSLLFQRVKSGEKIYERDLVKIIKRQLKPNTYYFDIGANIGLMAIPFLNYTPTLSILSFEPSPNAFPYLEKTVNNSLYKNRWTIINKAVSNEEGTLLLHLANPSLGAFDSFKNTKRVDYEASVEVQVTTIDKVWKEMNSPSVSVIKADTEGADLLVLMGAEECINATKPFIAIEWNRRNVDAFDIKGNDLIQFCKKMDYGIFGFPYLQRLETENEIRVFSNASDTLILIAR